MFNYDNIGSKIKKLAEGLFFLEAIAAVIIGVACWCGLGLEDGWWNIFVIILGPVIAWIGSWILYGFGEIIDKLCEIEHNTSRKNERKKKAGTNVRHETNEDSTSSVTEENEFEMPQVICQNCKTKYDFDAPKCPNCKKQNDLFVE